jgi:hypothetical protein
MLARVDFGRNNSPLVKLEDGKKNKRTTPGEEG